MKEIVVPDIGDFKDVEVIEVLVKPGERVAKEQSLITLESDKATMEIPSPDAGVVKELRVKLGDKVSQGKPILLLDAGGVAQAEKAESPKPQDTSERESTTPENTRAETTTITVPDIGDFKDVEVIEVLVKPGDRVTKEQSLITLESDKATMEIPSPAAGVVKAMQVKLGERVSKGSPVLLLAAQTEAAEPAPGSKDAAATEKPESEKAQRPPAPEAPPPAQTSTRPVPREPREETLSKPHASPSVRKVARELGVDLGRVKGSGPKGRILHTDVQAFVKGALSAAPAPAERAAAPGFSVPAWPEIDFAKFGPVEAKPLSRIQKLSGPNLHRNWLSIPHVTQFDEADITELEAFRRAQAAETEKRGFKLTLIAFLMKGCVTALKQYPQFNASLERSGEGLVIKKYYHLGVAVDTPEGLIVPVIRDVDRKGVFHLARELGEVAQLARDKKLKPGDLQGGTFSISSLGGIGGTAFTPIINAPEVAILGVSRSVMRPVWDGKQFAPRLMLPLSLSYDHRVIDGASAARFTSYLASVLSDIRKSLL
jgi:pyruvate dehydrogenase E2 component (dihydrolipoamide acetyltransferase)